MIPERALFAQSVQLLHNDFFTWRVDGSWLCTRTGLLIWQIKDLKNADNRDWRLDHIQLQRGKTTVVYTGRDPHTRARGIEALQNVLQNLAGVDTYLIVDEVQKYIIILTSTLTVSGLPPPHLKIASTMNDTTGASTMNDDAPILENMIAAKEEKKPIPCSSTKQSKQKRKQEAVSVI